MDIHFLAPGFLWLLLAIPALWFLPRRLRDTRHGLLRSALMALVILALAHPVFLAETERRHAVFVLDGSPSVSGAELDRARETALQLARELDEDDRAVLIELGQAWELPPGESGAFDRRLALANPTETDLPEALGLAARAIPLGARGQVTLISDGLSTHGRWGPALQELCARGLPLNTMALARPDDDVRPVRLDVEAPLRVGTSARLAVELVGGRATVDLRLVGPEGELDRIRGVELDGRARAVFEFEPQLAGFLAVEVEVLVTAGADSRSDNQRLARTLAIQDPLELLYLGERVRGGERELAALLGPGFHLRAPRAELSLAAQLERVDLVCLDDLPAETLDEAAQRTLGEAVSTGGLGLCMSGGGAAFGPGGWFRTPLAELLPVEFVQKEEKRDPSTTLVVIIDTSGSMGGNRVQLAKEVARLAMRRLLPHDKVGIVEFYGAKRWAAPIQPASNAIELERALNRLDAGGGTVILPAIEEAYYALKNVRTRYRHVLVLTDGGVEQGAFEPLMRRMAEDGMNVSTVLIGPDAHSEFLVSLSNWGKGRFYSVPNRFNLPEILLKQPTSAKLPGYRPGEHLVRARGGPGWWGDVDPAAIPPLAGYVETRPRPGAEVLLETALGAHPILSSWRYGLGRVTTFASEPTGGGTEPWRDWAGYGPFLARVLERTASDTREPWAFTLAREGVLLRLTAERRSADAPPPAAVLLEAAGEERPLSFRERADGLQVAELVFDPAREARVLAGAGGTGRRRLVSESRADVAPELAVDPRAALDLERAAAATAGVHLAAETAGEPQPIAVGGGAAPLAVRELRPPLIVLAILAFLADLFWRRRPGRRGAHTPA